LLKEFGAITMAFKYIQRKYGAFLNPGGIFVDIGSVRLYASSM